MPKPRDIPVLGEPTQLERVFRPDDPRGKESPPEYVAGKYNPNHLKHQMACLTYMMAEVMAGREELPRGFNLSQAQDILAFRAKHSGLDPKHALDQRTDAEKMTDAVDACLAAPESTFEFLDGELDIMGREFENAVRMCEEKIQERRNLAKEPDPQEEARLRRGKAMLSRVQKVRRLREWIRTPRTPPDANAMWVSGFEAVKPLLVMLYVTRSSMDQQLRKGSESKIHLIGRHHARFAVDTWEARNGVKYMPGTGKAEKGRLIFAGVQLIAPPAHGKTAFVMAYTVYELSRQPRTQGAYLHAKIDKAAENLQHIADMFSLTTTSGRRRNALYPGLTLAKRNNNATTLRLALPEMPKSPTMQAAGVTSAGLGGDTNFQVWDDVVPMSDRDQPTERERRFSQLNGTWLTRQRGEGTFVIFTGYYFHNQDAMARFTQLSRDHPKGRRHLFLVSRQTTGGPIAGEKGVFEPLWPEVYPAEMLKAKFNAMNRDMSLWSSNYMGNPISDSSRLVKKLRYYLPTIQQHTDFLASASFCLSVDPTATNRETSDKAATLYWAVGTVLTTIEGVEVFQTRARLIDATRLHLNQIELAEHIIQYSAQHSVNEVHLEVHSTNGSATRDILLEKGIEVTVHAPTIKSKALRLKSCSGLIDDSSADPTLRAVVEFPGQMEVGPDGVERLVCDERFRWLQKQIIDFGVESEDDGVDATSQFVNHLIATRQIEPGVGDVTRLAQNVMAQRDDPRVLAVLGRAERGNPRQSVDEEDARFLMGRNGE